MTFVVVFLLADWEETALTNGSDLLVRIKELALQGANATLARGEKV